LLTALAEVASAAHFQSIRRCKLPNALLENTISVVYLPHTSTFDNKRETATKKTKGEEKIKISLDQLAQPHTPYLPPSLCFECSLQRCRIKHFCPYYNATTVLNSEQSLFFFQSCRQRKKKKTNTTQHLKLFLTFTNASRNNSRNSRDNGIFD
jgi:hypothetical protein